MSHEKNYLLSAVIATMGIGIVIFTYKKANSQPKLTDIQLANLEALAQTESSQKCTRIREYGSCYKGNMWFCMYIKSVEEYTVPIGSPILCEHAHVTSCPSGTTPQ